MFGVKTVLSGHPVLHRFLLLLLLLGLSAPGFAQGTDTLAPVIELEELTDGVADKTQVFTVQVAEDGVLKDATLYYRREGQLPFTPAGMEPLGATGYFSVSIPTDPADLRTIEYYIQARDEAGNRTVSGFAFDPYQRTLRPAPDPLQSGETPVQTPPAQETPSRQTPLLRNRWVQISLGVLAVGIIASLASSDGGDDSSIVPLTFNLQ